jgi:hypothetical protein
MHYLSSIDFVSHLHMFRSYVAHHQEISLYINNSRYVLYILVECMRADSQLKGITRTNCCICTVIPPVDVDVDWGRGHGATIPSHLCL